MNQEKPKTERMKIDKTERLDIQSAESVADNSFKGSLQKGENLKGYIVDSLLSVSSGEAEIFIGNKNKETAVIKYYYPNFKPKEDILQKIHKLNHPDIITLHEYGYHNSRFFEIMEYAEGGTLSDKDANGKYKYLPMEEEQVIQIISETINAFKYFHEKGIIHRDIKPANLFFKNSDGSDILVGDFGISSELDVEGGMSKRMTSTIALSDGYAAPELYGIAKEDNKAKILIGPEVDYYALGITVYELLTGANPFAGRNALHIMRDTIEGRIIEDILTRPESENLSPRMKKLIRGLLTVRHDKRWGYSEVSEWLKGKDVKVFTEVHRPGIPPLKFGDKEINSIDGLVEAINNNRELGKKYLMRGMFEEWAKKFDESLANDIIDVKELDVDDYEKIAILLFKLDPSLPCRISDDIIINNINEILELLRNRPDFMGDIILDKEPSDFYPWLNVHYTELSEQFDRVSLNYNKDTKTSGKLSVISNLYISLAGDRIKPFPHDDYEISSLEDLKKIPAKYIEKVVELSKNKESILFNWLASKFNSEESSANVSEKISRYPYSIYPSLPCRLDENNSISTMDDLKELLRNRPEFMADIILDKKLLDKKLSDFYYWLDVRCNELIGKIQQVVKEYEKSRGISVTINRIPTIYNIYFILADNHIKPFPDEEFEISSIEDIITIPEKYRDKVLKELGKGKKSILYNWLLYKKGEKFMGAWIQTSKTWDNLNEIFAGNVVYHEGRYNTKERVADYYRSKKEQDRLNLIKLIKKIALGLLIFLTALGLIRLLN